MTEQVVIVTHTKDVHKTLFWGIFLAVIAIHFAGWIIAAAVLFVFAFGAYLMFVTHRAREQAKEQAEADERARVLARADQQRNWYEQGDPRWITGGSNEGPVG